MTTEPFKLEYGVEYKGVRHCDGELRLPTLEDVESALEESPEGACQARVNRYVWSRTIVRLGDIPKDDITPELLAACADTDYGVLLAAETSLRKKLKPANATPESGKSGKSR